MLSQAALDAVIVTLCRPLTWATLLPGPFN
jgi:hypothetical protein